MKEFLKRREFLVGSLLGIVGLSATRSIRVNAAEPAKITDKDILKEKQPAPIAHYCEKPSATNKVCPDWKDRQGHCSTCQFYVLDTKTNFKGKEFAKCQIVPTAPNYVSANAWCSTYTKRAGT